MYVSNATFTGFESNLYVRGPIFRRRALENNWGCTFNLYEGPPEVSAEVAHLFYTTVLM